MSKDGQRRKCYYDACSLESQVIYRDITDTNNQNFVSHLAIGEAYANCMLKGEVKASAFIELIKSVGRYIEIIGNDINERNNTIFEEIRNEFPNLSLTDSLHLAVAIHRRCEMLLTADADLHNLDCEQLKELSEKLSGTALQIKKVSIGGTKKKREPSYTS